MPGNRKNDDIEELSLDGKVELKINDIKIEPIDINVENLDFDTSESQNKSLNNSSTSDNSEGSLGVTDGGSNQSDAGVSENSNLANSNSNSSEDLSTDSENDSLDVSDDPGKSSVDDGANGENEPVETGTSSDSDDSENNQKKSSDKPESDEKEKKYDNLDDDKKGNENKDSGDKNKENSEKDKIPDEKKNNDQENLDKKDDKDKDKVPDDKKASDKPDTNKPTGNKPNNNPSANKPGQRKNSLKDKWDNRPKTPKDFANRTKNRAKNAVKNKARDAMDNSSIGRGINNVKDGIDKGKKAVNDIKKTAKIVKVLLTSKVFLIVLACILGVVIISVLPSLFASGSPGVGGEVEESDNYSKYSKSDQKIIDELKTLTEENPSGDPSYAMVATLYPYIEEMQNGNVASLRGKTNVEQEDDEDIYSDEEQDSDDEQQDKNTENEDGETEEDDSDTIANDQYLELFKERNIIGQRTYLRKFKKLLKESTGGEEALTTFLKNKWFKKDKGYKELFDDATDEEALKEAIIEDILSQKNDFLGYFFENKSCTTNFESAGTVEVSEMLKGNILVDVKVSSCTTGKDVWGCQSMYDAPIPMEKYVKGVTYEEIGVSGSSDVEKVKAQMVAAKSYAIGRSESMGWGTKKDSAGNYVITIRANTNDQDYCDIDLGCKSGRTEVRVGSAHRSAVDSATRAKLDEAWEATKDTYIYNTSKNRTAGEFCNSRSGVCDFCSKGTCLAHQELSDYKGTDFKTILADQYSKYQLVNFEGGVANLSVASALECHGSNNDGSCGLPDDTYKYYSQRDYKTEFCGRANATISSSGCGVTSMAMVISNLTDQTVTPEDTMKDAYNGYSKKYCGEGIVGTSSEYFSKAAKKYGLTYKQLSVNEKGAEEAAQVLRNGGLIIANVNSSSPFTNGGHYIVIRKIDIDGKVYVGDPNHKELNNTPYDLSSFINGWISSGHAWFAFTSPKSKDIVSKYCTTTSSVNTNGKFATNTRKNGTHAGQCIIYVESRAAEIIDSAQVGYDGINDRSKYIKIWSEGQFGGAKCALKDANVCSDHTKPNRMKKLFKTSSDYTKPQAGAVIVWDHGESNNYGHIAIIEEVKDNGSVVVSQSNWCSGSCEKYSLNTLTMSQVKNYGNHAFIGYIYLLQPIK